MQAYTPSALRRDAYAITIRPIPQAPTRNRPSQSVRADLQNRAYRVHQSRNHQDEDVSNVPKNAGQTIVAQLTHLTGCFRLSALASSGSC